MSGLLKVYISNIEYGITPHHIANMFYFQNIATVKRITLIPYIKTVGINDFMCYNKAHIEIKEWHDSEVAYNFIQKIKNPLVEARIIYDLIDEACWWVVEQYDTELCQKKRMTITDFMDYHDIDDEQEWLELQKLINYQVFGY
jgi:hypothetical protein